ncbi:MAG TPA: transporter substrate-binding domain-containing protein [Candidatus Limnocylindria bacterium]|nr:transporter substrate-binding domain-containing protein [Candidatus Limnocylindria bacterium]
MRRTLALAIAALMVVTACAPGASPGPATGAPGDAPPSFAADSTMGQIQAKGMLTCGVKFDVIAFGFRNPTTSEVEGFDADLCREIAAALGVQPEFVEAISANRIPFLLEDRVDVVISTMTRTAARLEEIDFSKIYYLAGQKILVKSESTYQTVDDLVSAAVKVCSAQGSTSEANLRTEGVAEANLVLFGTYSEAATALMDGRCEAVSTDDSILFGLAQQNAGTEVRGEVFSSEPLGIGIKKGKDDLVQFVNGVLDAMAADGRWAALYDKHIKPYTGEDAPEPPLDM